VHRRLKSIVDAPVRRALPQDPEVASRAVTVAHACTGDDAKFRLALAELVTESRNEVARKVDCKARRTLLWIPAARTWLQSDPTRAPLSPEDLARVFLATVYGKAKKNSTVIKKPKGSGGRRKKSDSERWESKVLRLVEQEVPRIERGQTMLSSLKVRYPANPGEWGNHLRRERYSSEEVTALLDNHSTIGAAQAVVSKSLKIALKSLQVACSKARRFKG
jgi:hypothetical protein